MRTLTVNKSATITFVIQEYYISDSTLEPVPITEIEASDISLYYKKEGGIPVQKTINSSNFSEVDAPMSGFYEIQFTAQELDTEGEFVVSIRSVTSAFPQVRQSFLIEKDLSSPLLSKNINASAGVLSINKGHDALLYVIHEGSPLGGLTSNDISARVLKSDGTFQIIDTSSWSPLQEMGFYSLNLDPSVLNTEGELLLVITKRDWLPNSPSSLVSQENLQFLTYADNYSFAQEYAYAGSPTTTIVSWDGGESWEQISLTFKDPEADTFLRSVDALDGTGKAWAVSSNRIFSLSKSGISTLEGSIQNYPSTVNEIFDVASVSASNIRVAADGGQFLFSSDEGSTWELDTFFTAEDEFFFHSDEVDLDGEEWVHSYARANLAWAVSSAGDLARTFDTGVTWSLDGGAPSYPDGFLKVHGSEDRLAVLSDKDSSEDQYLFFSDGPDWYSLLLSTSETVKDVHCIGTDIWLCGTNSWVLKVDVSDVLDPITTSPTLYGTPLALNALTSSISNLLWFACDGGKILQYDISGDTWSLDEPSGSTENLRDISFGASLGWAVGDNGSILRFTLGTWAVLNSPFTNSLTSVAPQGSNDSEVWISGEGGILVRSTNASVLTPNWLSGFSNGSYVINVSSVSRGDRVYATTGNRIFSRLPSDTIEEDLLSVAYDTTQIAGYQIVVGTAKGLGDESKIVFQRRGVWNYFIVDNNITLKDTAFRNGKVWICGQELTQSLELRSFLAYLDFTTFTFHILTIAEEETLNSVYIDENDEVWIVGDSGTFLKATPDNGSYSLANVVWNLTPSSNLLDIVVDEFKQEYYILDHFGDLYYTDNEGSGTWTVLSMDPQLETDIGESFSSRFRSLSSNQSGSLFLVGNDLHAASLSKPDTTWEYLFNDLSNLTILTLPENIVDMDYVYNTVAFLLEQDGDDQHKIIYRRNQASGNTLDGEMLTPSHTPETLNTIHVFRKQQTSGEEVVAVSGTGSFLTTFDVPSDLEVVHDVIKTGVEFFAMNSLFVAEFPNIIGGGDIPCHFILAGGTDGNVVAYPYEYPTVASRASIWFTFWTDLFNLGPVGTGDTIRDIQLLGEGLLVVGDNGLVATKADAFSGGWTVFENLPLSVNLLSAVVVSLNEFWISGEGGVMIRTTDSGVTWATIDTKSDTAIFKIVKGPDSEIWSTQNNQVFSFNTEGLGEEILELDSQHIRYQVEEPPTVTVDLDPVLDELDLMKGSGFDTNEHSLENLKSSVDSLDIPSDVSSDVNDVKDLILELRGVGFDENIHSAVGIFDAVDAIESGGSVDLSNIEDILTSIQGDPFVEGNHSLKALRDVLDGLPTSTTDLTPVLDELDTVQTALDDLKGLGFTGDESLVSIKGALDSLDTSLDLTPVLEALGDMSGEEFDGESHSLQALREALDSLDTTATDLAPVLTELDIVQTALDDIKGLGFDVSLHGLRNIFDSVDGLDTNVDLSSVLDLLGDMAGESFNGENHSLQALREALEALETEATDLTPVLEALDDIKGQGFTEEESLVALKGDLEGLDSGHLTTVQEKLDSLVESSARILGLSQENYRITDQVYNDSNKLISAKLSLFESESDTNANTNPIATYSMVAVYNIQGLLVDYKVTKDD